MTTAIAQTNNKFLDAVYAGLMANANKHTEETLGDRSTYIGASDVGSCPRKTILSKLHPSTHNLQTLMRFLRGHLAEDILATAFAAKGFTFVRQMEVEHDCYGAPSKAHIDFVFIAEATKTVAVLEVKSPEHMPDTPYDSWEAQLYMQMGLVAKKYPGYTVKGGILGFQFGDDGLRLWDKYKPNDAVFAGLEERCANTWNDLQLVRDGQEIEMKTEWSPLCEHCDHIGSCPRFQGEVIPEYDDMVLEYLSLKDQSKKLDKEIDASKQTILNVIRKRGGQPFKAGGRLLREAKRSRLSVDQDALGAFLSDFGKGVDEFKVESSYSLLETPKAA